MAFSLHAIKDAAKAMEHLANVFIDTKISMLSAKSYNYKCKYIQACWLTKFYWKFKYKKADKELHDFISKNHIPMIASEQDRFRVE